jgi:hypothetical protein
MNWKFTEEEIKIAIPMKEHSILLTVKEMTIIVTICDPL